ncbi:MAG: hypothetical protein FJ110_01785 [Deltaproteobacteria bacterium]|nr:hypothetical protein [Deltaproteobacteria bacterium]
MNVRLVLSWSDLPRTAFRVLLCLFVLSGLIPNFSQAQKIYDDLFSVTFPNEKEGWASGRWGCVLHTADRGKSWVRLNTGTDLTLSSVFFVDSKNGWAVGEEGIIIHTKDGGKNWEKQKSPVRFFHMKVFFVSPLKGWIVSEQTHILHTSDGGKTWTVQFKDQDFILKSISFSDPLHGWAVGEFGYIYHTRNGGNTWERLAGEYGLSVKTGEIEGGTFLFDVKALDPQTVWAVGIDGYVIKTDNGGKTWKEVKTGAPKTQLFCIGSDRKSSLLMGGFGAFLYSSDRGRTWKTPQFTPPATYDWFYGIANRGQAGFVAVGGGGMIYINEGKNPSNWNRVAY